MGIFNFLRSKPKPEEFIQAASDGNISMVKSYLSKGINPNITTSSGVTALMLAAQQQHPEVVEALITHKADTNMQGP
jgi:ankyrin repeat protein